MNAVECQSNTCRQTNIELCRIFSIILVLLVHSGFQSLGTPESLEKCSVGIIFMQAFSIIGVDVFIFISGWFSIRPKKQSIVNLLFIIVFYGLLKIVSNLAMETFELKQLLIVSQSSWFLPSYLGLFILSPALNLLFEKSDKKTITCIVVCMFLFNAYYGSIPACDVDPGANHGYSMVSFVTIYMIARYLRLYGIPRFISRHSVVLYVLCSLLIGSVELVGLRLGTTSLGIVYDYSEPLVVLSSVCFFASFEKLKLKNSRIINHTAQSVLAVLLIHTSTPVIIWMKQNFNYIFDNQSGVTLVACWMASVVSLFLICVVIDQIRLILYKPIKKLTLKNLEK